MKNLKVNLFVSCEIKMMEYFFERRMGEQRLNEGALLLFEFVLIWFLFV